MKILEIFHYKSIANKKKHTIFIALFQSQ